MGTLGVVLNEVRVEIDLHLVQGFVPLDAARDPKVLVQQRAVQPLDEPVGLRPANLGGAMLDALQLQEELVGVGDASIATRKDS